MNELTPMLQLYLPGCYQQDLLSSLLLPLVYYFCGLSSFTQLITFIFLVSAMFWSSRCNDIVNLYVHFALRSVSLSPSHEIDHNTYESVETSLMNVEILSRSVSFVWTFLRVCLHSSNVCFSSTGALNYYWPECFKWFQFVVLCVYFPLLLLSKLKNIRE